MKTTATLLVAITGSLLLPYLAHGSDQHDKCLGTKLAPTPACHEVTIGAQVWSYERLYPLLDGLFQDIASTQLSPLTLSPNASNGSQLDALAQSFQLQVGFNQMSALQNQAAAQMLNGNTTLQSSLLQQQASLLQQTLTAQNQLAQAQNTLLKDQNAGQPTNIIASDTLAQTEAQNNLTALTADMTQLTAQIKAPSFNPGFTPGSIANPVAAATPLSAASLWSPSTNAAPSFPATKQMDNQVQLLWERLSRLMGIMVKPDSANPDDTIYLVQLDTGIFPVDRKNQLLDMKYSLGCKVLANGTAPTPPKVLDIFPRMAAVNITNTKYRDTQTVLGVALSWLGFGINSSYNREHMRVSQLLGQSSYITGYGVGQTSFGWKFGIPLGDDQVSSDTRRTFVLVSVPNGCDPTLTREEYLWVDKGGTKNGRQDINSTTAQDLKAWTNIPTPSLPVGGSIVASIDFNRTEYDPSTVTATSPVVVSLTVGLNRDIDQQLTVTVNGTLIKRARDAFARAINNGGTSGGLLESPSLADNTWIPVSSRTLLMNLDGIMFGEHFPEIILASPRTIHNLNSEIASAATCPILTVSGHTIADAGGSSVCLDKIPSLAYKKPTVRAITAVRVLQGLPEQNNDHYRVMFTDLGANASQAPSSASTATDIRVVSNSSQVDWSSATEVYEMDQLSGALLRLQCDMQASTGSKLICDLPAHGPNPPDETLGAKYQIVDVDHIVDSNNTIGVVKGWTTLGPCDDKTTDTCKIPTYWNIVGPASTAADTGWSLTVEFVNVNTQNSAEPTGATLGQLQSASCASRGEGMPLQVVFNIAPNQISELQDSMALTLLHGNIPMQTVKITNLLTNSRPTATAVSSDVKTWTGSNLLSAYTSMRIGNNGPLHAIMCTSDNLCQLSPAEDLTKELKAGFVYLIAAISGGTQVAVPLMSKATNGTETFATYTPPTPQKPGAGQATPTGQGSVNSGNNTSAPAPPTPPAPIIATQNVTSETS